jgi:4-nitrophenyl phosphatase
MPDAQFRGSYPGACSALKDFCELAARIIRRMQSHPAATPRLVVFDLDGVVYRGPQAIPDAAALLASLRRAGCLIRFATNNSMSTRQAYAERLAGHGIAASSDEIVTSTSATIEHLHHHLPDVRRILAVGADGMLAELEAGGFVASHARSVEAPEWYGAPLTERWDAVVVGLDPMVDYRTLGIAAAAIRQGARFIATNTDLRYPTPDGFMPGAGAIVAGVQASSGAAPLVIGKPQPAMFLAMLEAAGIAPGDALVIGDNPDSDIPAARRAGIRSVLVLTGVADEETAAKLDGEGRPDWVLRGPAEVAELLGLELS